MVKWWQGPLFLGHMQDLKLYIKWNMTFIFKLDFAYLYFIQASQVKGASCQDYASNKRHTEKLTQSSKSCTVQESEITTRKSLSAVKSSQDTFKFCGSKKVLWRSDFRNLLTLAIKCVWQILEHKMPYTSLKMWFAAIPEILPSTSCIREACLWGLKASSFSGSPGTKALTQTHYSIKP